MWDDVLMEKCKIKNRKRYNPPPHVLDVPRRVLQGVGDGAAVLTVGGDLRGVTFAQGHHTRNTFQPPSV